MLKKNDGSQPQKKDIRKFIDNHPSRTTALPRNVDRSAYDVGTGVPVAGPAPTQGADWQQGVAQQILVYRETEPEMQGADWMSQLKQDSAQFLADQRGVRLQDIYRESIYKTGIAILVDKIYGLLQRYTYEFNQVAAGTELHVSGTISGETTEVTRYNRFREAEETKTYFRCRFSTRLVSLTVRGQDDKVEAFVLPANQAMALSKCEDSYSPICMVQVKITEQGMMWRMKDGVPSVESLDQLCMWLFGMLIQETKAVAAMGEDAASG